MPTKNGIVIDKKACRKKEMDFLAAYIKSVNQQVNEQEDIKLL